jgi:glycosyltransferase involved in cell wall biosynthesis
MNLFAFASTSETQGMVLTEAMAAGVPVVAVDASGVREVVSDGRNGRLLCDPTPGEFAEALQSIASLSGEEIAGLQQGARATADEFSMDRQSARALAIYASLVEAPYLADPHDIDAWERVLHLFKAEWEIARNFIGATGAALNRHRPPE